MRPIAHRQAASAALSTSHFERICALIHRRAGITLAPSRRTMVSNRLAPRLRALEMTRYDDYLALVEGGHGEESQAFTNALTTNLTAFFREAHHFPILAEHLKQVTTPRAIEIWCAASSTGEEPYSIAMTARDALGDDAARVKILASDIDTAVLARASEGIYDDTRIESLDAQRTRRHFLKGTGTNAGSVRVRDALRQMVIFRRINLLEKDWSVRSGFDAIFCRNVLIYFDAATQLAVLERFAGLLRPQGLLFAGHSESLHHAAHLFRLRGRSVYQLADTDAASRRAPIARS